MILIRLVGGIIDRICALAGALCFSQAPLFMQQYKQQLFGRVEELELQVKVLKDAAQLSGKNLEEYIAKFIQSPDPDFSRQGEIMQNMYVRLVDLKHSLFALSDADLWNKPLSFLHHYNHEVGKATWKYFELGVPMTTEGAVYALFGLGFGFLVFYLLKQFLLTSGRAIKSLLFFKTPKIT